MLTEKSFDTGQLIINFSESETTRPPLVLLHGSTLNWQSLEEFVPVLEESWHIYACDLPGHGKSGHAESGYVFENFVSPMAAFLEHLVGEPAVLLGFSLGAAIALGVAARLPSRVRALILLEPALSFYYKSGLQAFPNVDEWFTWVKQTRTSSHSLEEVMARYRERAPDADEASTLRFSQAFYDLDPEFLTDGYNNRVYNNYQPEQLLSQVVCPTLVIYGETKVGSILNNEDIELLKKQVPHAILVQIKDAGHGVIWGAAGQIVFEQVTRFLHSL